jgi:hypothetical protein
MMMARHPRWAVPLDQSDSLPMRVEHRPVREALSAEEHRPAVSELVPRQDAQLARPGHEGKARDAQEVAVSRPGIRICPIGTPFWLNTRTRPCCVIVT